MQESPDRSAAPVPRPMSRATVILDREIHLSPGHTSGRARRGRHAEAGRKLRLTGRGGEAELANSDSPVALIRRFDRRGNTRIPYISARTALDWDSDEGGFYTDIAEVIRQISSKPVEDLHELWRRIVFTILVSNKDDHLKNHGFIYAGGDRWRLSPAFDINPSPSRQRVLETGIVRGGSFDASLEIALEACEFFDLKRENAKAQASAMAQMIAEGWKQAMRVAGCTSDDVHNYANAFQHDESHRALAI